MKQEKLCEIEDMTDKDYSRWYGDPVDEQKFKEELGAENARQHDPRIVTAEDLKFIEKAAMARAGEAIREYRALLGETTDKKANERQIGGNHYKRMDIQPWDVIDYGPKQQAIGYYRYNALKYVMRAGEKGEFKEDIAKAHHYLQKLLEILE